MPILLPADLPVAARLRDEGLAVACDGDEGSALRIAFVNLMPDKATTEMQIFRLLGRSSHRVAPILIHPASRLPRSAAIRAHVERFYRLWPETSPSDFDAMLITGAPIERLDFDEVDYWDEIVAMLECVKRRWGGLLALCWAAQAAMHRYHGVPKRVRDDKLFGLYRHRQAAPSPLLSGMEVPLLVPVSRYSETDPEDAAIVPHLQPLLESPQAGLCLIEDLGLGHVYMLNHLEYDARTLDDEYRRDLDKGERAVSPPFHPGEGIDMAHEAGLWRRAGVRLFDAWIERAAAAENPSRRA